MAASSFFWRTLIMYALVPVGASAANSVVSLSNFVPRIENLPSQCQSVYVKTIQGCREGDFTSTGGCSQACVNGLVSITRDVRGACSNVRVDADSIIGVFLDGRGIPSICRNVAITTVAPTSTPAPRPPPQPTSEAEDDEETTTTIAASSTSEASSSTSSGLQIDPGVPTDAASSIADVPPANTAQPPPPAATAPDSEPSSESQTSGNNLGDGSPFDLTIGSGASSQLQHLGKSPIGWILGTAILFTLLL